jgi:hypothetical protein
MIPCASAAVFLGGVSYRGSRRRNTPRLLSCRSNREHLLRVEASRGKSPGMNGRVLSFRTPNRRARFRPVSPDQAAALEDRFGAKSVPPQQPAGPLGRNSNKPETLRRGTTAGTADPSPARSSPPRSRPGPSIRTDWPSTARSPGGARPRSSRSPAGGAVRPADRYGRRPAG